MVSRIMKDIVISFKSEINNIIYVRNMIQALTIDYNQTISFINELKTIVSEAITNAVVHAYDGNEDGDIKLSVRLEDEGIYLKISDIGKGIEDIEKAKEVLYTTKPELERSGLGFTIMELFSTSFNVISNVGTGTTLEIFKKWE